MPDPDGYADLLRATIDTKSSRRKLGALMASRTGNKQESEYRALGKYLAGETPTRERAAVIAVLLDEPALALVSDRQSRKTDRLEQLAEEVGDLRGAVLALLRAVQLLDEQGGGLADGELARELLAVAEVLHKQAAAHGS